MFLKCEKSEIPHLQYMHSFADKDSLVYPPSATTVDFAGLYSLQGGWKMFPDVRISIFTS